MATRRVIRPYLVEFLLNHVGQPVTLEQITKGMPRGTESDSVQSGMRNLINSGELEITVLARGKSWRLESVERPWPIEAAAPVDELSSALDTIELVGTMQDGTVVVKDGDGQLYRLVAL